MKKIQNHNKILLIVSGLLLLLLLLCVWWLHTNNNEDGKNQTMKNEVIVEQEIEAEEGLDIESFDEADGNEDATGLPFVGSDNNSEHKSQEKNDPKSQEKNDSKSQEKNDAEESSEKYGNFY